MRLNENIKKVTKMMKNRTGVRFKLIYKFSTENIDGYINIFDFKNKNYLTVGSSGDQAINANFYGCNDITVVDLNCFTSYYFNLKKAALLALDYDMFIKFFSITNDKEFISKSIYNKIRETLHSISLESLIFWDYVYDNNCNFNNLFHYNLDGLTNINLFNSYLTSEENYNIEKNNITKLKIRFINYNILKSNKIFISEKFDNINLSNIYCYNTSFYKVRKFKEGVNKLIERLSDDGTILVSYLYDTNHNTCINEFRKNNIEATEYYTFKGVYESSYCNNTYDTAIVYKKKLNNY